MVILPRRLLAREPDTSRRFRSPKQMPTRLLGEPSTMTMIFRALCVVAALYAATVYYFDDPDTARKNLADAKNRASALSQRAPELAEGFGAKVEEVKKNASGAKNRLDSIREKVEASMESSRERSDRGL